MDSVHISTELDLARVGLELCVDPDRVLVGGLGLGVTARACLADPRVRRLTVVEIEQPVVDWLAAGLVPGGTELLADPRLQIVVTDLADHVRETDATYDVALLDIDNGPGYLVHETNARVYSATFLQELRGLLSPGGVVVIWSSAESPALARAMGAAFTDARVLRQGVDLQGRDEEYFLYVGRE